MQAPEPKVSAQDLIDLTELAYRTGYSTRWVLKMVEAQKAPAPLKLRNKACLWDRVTAEHWINSLAR